LVLRVTIGKGAPRGFREFVIPSFAAFILLLEAYASIENEAARISASWNGCTSLGIAWRDDRMVDSETRDF
jgi:hypothetical protein